MNQSINVTAVVRNDGSVKADETIFMFVRDLVGSYTRPVRELKDFKRLTLIPGEIKGVNFTIDADKLKFWTKNK